MIVTNSDDRQTELSLYGDTQPDGSQLLLAEVTHDHSDTELPLLVALFIDDIDVINTGELKSRWLTLGQATELVLVLQRQIEAATLATQRALETKETT